MLYIEGGIFLTIQWFDLNSSSKNLFERSSIKVFFIDFSVHFLMYLCILFIALKILKFSLSGLILINTQLSSISLLRFLSACSNSPTSITILCL